MFRSFTYLTCLGLLASSFADNKFLAFPKDRDNQPQTNATDKAIRQLIGSDQVYVYNSKYFGVSFWLAPMTQDQQAKVKKFPGVDRISENIPDATQDEAVIPVINYPDLPVGESQSETSSGGIHKREEILDYPNLPVGKSQEDVSSGSLQKREGTLKSRPNPPDELKLVSWAKGKKWSDLNSYAYDENLGTDTWIYLVENGVKADHPDISRNAPEKPYFYGPDAANTDVDDSPVGHGTCMASKAAGSNLGVASNAHMIVLKAKPTPADNLWAFEHAHDDIIDKQRKGKAVILFARGARLTGMDNDDPWPALKPKFPKLFADDIVIVTSSGNNGRTGHTDVDLVPKTWAADDYPLIVVGATDTQGKIALRPGETVSFSQGGDKVAVWAPGKDITCARHDSDGTRLDTGTSPASAMTAGLVAYFLSLRNSPPFHVGGGNTAKNARDFLSRTANWVRPDGQNKAIWNLVDSTTVNAVTPVTPKVAPAAPVTPSCTNDKRTGLHDDYHFTIQGMTGNVIKDGGNELQKQEYGCGALNSWHWTWTKDDKSEASVTFNQPWGIKGGCIERAFMTAARGPQIPTCKNV